MGVLSSTPTPKKVPSPLEDDLVALDESEDSYSESDKPLVRREIFYHHNPYARASFCE